ILLDEPSSFMDPKHQVLLAEILEKINREQGVGVLVASHDVNSLAELATKVIALKDTKLQFFGDKQRFLSEEQLATVYDVRFSILANASTGRSYAVVEGRMKDVGVS
ncbi:hypothetical protein BVY02_02165, partial [bacterium J17]